MQNFEIQQLNASCRDHYYDPEYGNSILDLIHLLISLSLQFVSATCAIRTMTTETKAIETSKNIMTIVAIVVSSSWMGLNSMTNLQIQRQTLKVT